VFFFLRKMIFFFEWKEEKKSTNQRYEDNLVRCSVCPSTKHSKDTHNIQHDCHNHQIGKELLIWSNDDDIYDKSHTMITFLFCIPIPHNNPYTYNVWHIETVYIFCSLYRVCFCMYPHNHKYLWSEDGKCNDRYHRFDFCCIFYCLWKQKFKNQTFYRLLLLIPFAFY